MLKNKDPSGDDDNPEFGTTLEAFRGEIDQAAQHIGSGPLKLTALNRRIWISSV